MPTIYDNPELFLMPMLRAYMAGYTKRAQPIVPYVRTSRNGGLDVKATLDGYEHFPASEKERWLKACRPQEQERQAIELWNWTISGI